MIYHFTNFSGVVHGKHCSSYLRICFFLFGGINQIMANAKYYTYLGMAQDTGLIW
jgi:hypothetical protein